jgi:hypothetical protein
MKFFSIIFLAFMYISVNGQSSSIYKKVTSKFTFENANKSTFKKARTSFANNALKPYACIDNYGCTNIALAVIDLQFWGIRISETNVQLNWTTTGEINNNGFEIQKKIGEIGDFKKIGFQYATEQQNTENKYELLDLNESSETSYYRLKIIDSEGKHTFSKIIAIKSFDQSLALRIASNPIIGNEIAFEIFGLKANTTINLCIFDLLGRKIIEGNHFVSNSNNIIIIPKNSSFNVGKYFAKASFNDKILINNFVILQ